MMTRGAAWLRAGPVLADGADVAVLGGGGRHGLHLPPSSGQQHSRLGAQGGHSRRSRELNHGGYKCPGNNLYRPPRQCSHQPARPAARPGPAPPHHRSTAVASHHTPTQTFWSLILYNVTHKNNTYKGMSHNGDKYYNLTMIEPNIGSCNLVILPQG